MQKLYRRIPYLVTFVILTIMGAQLYWSYIEFKKNSTRFKNDIQQVLDVALDNYFIEATEDKNITIIAPRGTEYSQNTNLSFENKMVDAVSLDTTLRSISVVKGKQPPDSVFLQDDFKTVYISVNKDTIDFEKFRTLVNEELTRKEYALTYVLRYYKKDTVFASFQNGAPFSNYLTATGKSTYLKEGEKITMLFPNEVGIILKKSLFSILLSVLITLVILFSLFYLLRIVKQQKQLSEIKNDLISNITHEFKTPIATIGAAMESIRHFNENNDVEKTNRYLDYSNQQLAKLGKMVDQLMDTALMDSNEWTMNRLYVPLKDWIDPIVESYTLHATDKVVTLRLLKTPEKNAYIDPFHLGNALGCILDNAIKYGGDKINISVTNEKENGLIIEVSDNGGNITKEQSSKIFDKFYRIPRGNLHDVKGYGIGLYHVKKIVEKHNGKVSIQIKNNITVFIISIPYE